MACFALLLTVALQVHATFWVAISISNCVSLAITCFALLQTVALQVHATFWVAFSISNPVSLMMTWFELQSSIRHIYENAIALLFTIQFNTWRSVPLSLRKRLVVPLIFGTWSPHFCGIVWIDLANQSEFVANEFVLMLSRQLMLPMNFTCCIAFLGFYARKNQYGLHMSLRVVVILERPSPSRSGKGGWFHWFLEPGLPTFVVLYE